jgi:hypothetical protein
METVKATSESDTERKVGKPAETPSLFKNVVRPFLNRWSAVHKTREIFSLQFSRNLSLPKLILHCH